MVSIQVDTSIRTHIDSLHDPQSKIERIKSLIAKEGFSESSAAMSQFSNEIVQYILDMKEAAIVSQHLLCQSRGDGSEGLDEILGRVSRARLQLEEAGFNSPSQALGNLVEWVDGYCSGKLPGIATVGMPGSRASTPRAPSLNALITTTLEAKVTVHAHSEALGADLSAKLIDGDITEEQYNLQAAENTWIAEVISVIEATVSFAEQLDTISNLQTRLDAVTRSAKVVKSRIVSMRDLVNRYRDDVTKRLERALTVSETLGPEDIRMGITLNMLSEWHTELDAHDKAESYINKHHHWLLEQAVLLCRQAVSDFMQYCDPSMCSSVGSELEELWLSLVEAHEQHDFSAADDRHRWISLLIQLESKVSSFDGAETLVQTMTDLLDTIKQLDGEPASADTPRATLVRRVNQDYVTSGGGLDEYTPHLLCLRRVSGEIMRKVFIGLLGSDMPLLTLQQALSTSTDSHLYPFYRRCCMFFGDSISKLC